jgi:hypothetical protein
MIAAKILKQMQIDKTKDINKHRVVESRRADVDDSVGQSKQVRQFDWTGRPRKKNYPSDW